MKLKELIMNMSSYNMDADVKILSSDNKDGELKIMIDDGAEVDTTEHVVIKIEKMAKNKK